MVGRPRVAEAGLGAMTGSSIVQGLALASAQHPACRQTRGWRKGKPNGHARRNLGLWLGKAPAAACVQGTKPGSQGMREGPRSELHYRPWPDQRGDVVLDVVVHSLLGVKEVGKAGSARGALKDVDAGLPVLHARSGDLTLARDSGLLRRSDDGVQGSKHQSRGWGGGGRGRGYHEGSVRQEGVVKAEEVVDRRAGGGGKAGGGLALRCHRLSATQAR